ncbi:anti-sigma regulatory factor (Ser/Thr protein kinase) [Kribbella amoyensis]|uniref:Anti-sigma regulatory factor (Ser/Thr protein kinase) n=1 Tax=Kribbella amoyensis TaxID=996641 RepID=A0A561B947_9ACTN|nr:sensor histidine kinase [Kribbella amoyensis]TWD75278.1 anti-sigma regulatory factor (Ser/Thr protein kinase) [Kribbella amoyensis]
MGFEHDAFVYSDDDDFLDQAAPFLHRGLTAGETVVAALPELRNDLLRGALGRRADQVIYVDIADVGRNPARIIPLWRALLDQAPGIPLRGLGEPAYPGRSAAELDEAILNELLLNVAFGRARSFRLRCPYSAKVDADPAGLHPSTDATRAAAATTFCTPLSPVPLGAVRMPFGLADLGEIRQTLEAQARPRGLDGDRLDDLTLALHEICTNSIRFGGGRGRLSLWAEGGMLVCDVADHGRIDDLLVGRVLPPTDRLGGRGVWMANQLCDLVQVRSGGSGTQVRLHAVLR